MFCPTKQNYPKCSRGRKASGACCAPSWPRPTSQLPLVLRVCTCHVYTAYSVRTRATCIQTIVCGTRAMCNVYTVYSVRRGHVPRFVFTVLSTFSSSGFVTNDHSDQSHLFKLPPRKQVLPIQVYALIG